MSTRATYTFIDFPDAAWSHGPVSVYKHWDGYPSQAAQSIAAALEFAWTLPRFEADEFAAAFVAANKPAKGGGVRLIGDGDWKKFAEDQEYHYEITVIDGKLLVAAFSVSIFYGSDEDESIVELYRGPLEGLATVVA